MTTAVTKGVKISVEVRFHAEYSEKAPQNIFTYRITIENTNPYTIQLLHRHWYIFDSTAPPREVEGKGVVGKQPILYPDEHYQYVSWCNLHTDIGRMYGTYLMQRIDNGQQFSVRIPAFEMMVPYKLS